jgi:hypothetical protein
MHFKGPEAPKTPKATQMRSHLLNNPEVPHLRAPSD